MCRVRKSLRSIGFPHANEIIQLGAVLMDEKYEILSEFNRYVKPEFGELDSYISKLTGITENDLKGSATLKDVLADFGNWIPDDEVYMVSWSDVDRFQLAAEMRSKQINISKISDSFEMWIDSQKLFSERVNNERRYSLEEVIFACDIDAKGRLHDGYYDAYNTSLLFRKIMMENEIVFNPYYTIAKNSETNHLTFSLEGILDGINFEECAGA